MKTSTLALRTLLATGKFVMADFYTITTVANVVHRFTSAEMDLSFGGFTFLTSGPKFKRGKTRTVIGIEVDTLDVDVMANSGTLLGSDPILLAIHNGVLDGAKLKLEKAFLPDWGQAVTGTVYMFGGRVADISDLSRIGGRLSIKSDLEVLNIQMPRNLYLPSCMYTLFDGGCALSKAAFSVASTVASGSTRTVINCGLANASGFFDQGSIVIGGIVRNVKSYVPGEITLSYPLPAIPSVGAAITAYPGCDKKQSTCDTKFSNLVHFRGYPYVPVPEAAL